MPFDLKVSNDVKENVNKYLFKKIVKKDAKATFVYY